MIKLKWGALVCLCLILIGAMIYRVRSYTSAAKQSATLDQLRGYTKWQQVTVRPAPMLPDAAALCVALPSGYHDPVIRKAQSSPDNPHAKKYFRVYVNDIGMKAMLSHVPSQFPVGSVVIKEKLSSPASKTPELLTIMIKRHPGYHEEWGDWEYMVTNGAATKVEADSSFEHCYGCHAAKKSSDYIFRDYGVAFQPDLDINRP